MLWSNYVFERGLRVHDMWDRLFHGRTLKLLYITGIGFDLRSQRVLAEIKSSLAVEGRALSAATMLKLDFRPYELSGDLVELTKENSATMSAQFAALGHSETLSISEYEQLELGSAVALTQGIGRVLERTEGYTDIVLDVSSLPRVVYVALITGILRKLVPDKDTGDSRALAAGGVNFQVLVGEDSALDSLILAEDPENEVMLVPGFAGPLHAESAETWPLVWFPILGERRVNQLQKIMMALIPSSAEICPVLPHPSKMPRRADNLLIEYREALFDVRTIAMSNLMYADESNPFEVYRQLLGAMTRYRETMAILGGCRLVVSPLSSKLMTVGAALACFEIRPSASGAKFGISIPHAEPKRYAVEKSDIVASKPEVTTLLLTGEAFA